MDRELNKKIILCAPEVSRSSEKLIVILYGAVRCAPLEVYGRIHLLKKRLLGPKADISSAVLMASSVEDFKAIMPLQPLLEGIPVLLVLPAIDSYTIALAHRFSPRFIAHRNDELSDVARVAVKILKKDGAIENAVTI